MSITLTVGATTVALPEDLYWSDEYAWSPVEQTVQRSITGALLVSVATRLAGRPITLKPEDNSSAWCTRSQLAQLQAWADVPGLQMTLSLRGVDHTVLWRHADGAIETSPVVHYNAMESADFYLAAFRFLEV